MQASKDYLKENGYNDRISFSDGSAHKVKLLKEKEDTIPDGRGGTVKGMKYLVEEGGAQKTFFTGSLGLISKLADLNEGDVVTIQMKKANNKSFFVVIKDNGEVVGEHDDEIGDNDVPEPQPSW